MVALVAAIAGFPAVAQANGHDPSPPGVHYGPGVEETTVEYPAPTPGAPTVVLVHGGGWRTQKPHTNREAEAAELQAHGFAVFYIYYPQDTPSVRAFPMEPEAIERAVLFAREHAAEANGDPRRLVLLGGSAGGNLVEIAAEHVAVSEVIALSAPSELDALLEASDANIVEDARQALGCLDGPCNMTFGEQWSPARHVVLCSRYLLFSSVRDPVPLPQAKAERSALEAAGCPVSLNVLKGKAHAFEYWPTISAAVYAFIETA